MRRTFLFLGSLLLTILLYYIAHAEGKVSYVNITVYNPYRLSARLEVKCDYNQKTKHFNFHQFIDIPGRQATRVSVPNSQKECQIWPKIKLGK